MTTDDEIVFLHVRDESRSTYDRLEKLRNAALDAVTPDLAFALAEFELHGATLRSLRRWYPLDDRVRQTLANWEVLSLELASRGLPVEA
jgi:hypothetical protein